MRGDPRPTTMSESPIDGPGWSVVVELALVPHKVGVVQFSVQGNRQVRSVLDRCVVDCMGCAISKGHLCSVVVLRS